MNVDWYIMQILKSDSGFPLTLDKKKISKLRPKPWKGGDLKIPIDIEKEDFGISENYDLDDTLNFDLPDTTEKKYIYVNEQIFLSILKNNQWERPIYFTAPYPEWIRPYLRPEGIVWQFMPGDSIPINKELLRRNLYEIYTYKGYNDPDVWIESQSEKLGHNYYRGFYYLAGEEQRRGNGEKCEKVVKDMKEFMPPERLNLDPRFLEALGNICKNDK